MAKQRETSGISDEILMSFMNKIDASVNEIKAAVSDLKTDHVQLKERFYNHVSNEKTIKDVEESHNKKATIYLTIISILVGAIIFGLGYIWDKDKNNGRVQERIERPLK